MEDRHSSISAVTQGFRRGLMNKDLKLKYAQIANNGTDPEL